VNAVPDSPPPAEVGATAVDARNPWLGLASFTEETRAYFYGREDEVAELARRVQRKLLTVLFGQSGLGKTSILRAGLVPRLRGQGYCPVYVRVDYGRDAPEPAEQIKQAIARSATRSGEWTQVGVAAEGESLWEFLHHRDDVLRDESGDTLIPLLIFDQFEEIFTLAQTDDFGRARAARFIADLADLVENRAPKSLEAKLDADDTLAERFDFARSDYRVLIALREDYLAPLEGLKGAMPSITQNRLRLAPMTGSQALTAVMRPGNGLVSEEVAAAIVRFVAGGAELANAEVEPSLLSLICRELNDARIEQGRDEISLDLLAGSHATILSNFYERALADQPAAVRRIIEDQLLTASGYRENIAEERLVSALAAAGAAPETLAVLVNRRLLRIEERLDVRRVELTHDVLCGVVKASRDLRHEREKGEATERLLAEQRARELAARHALVRARQVASVCAVLAIAAVFAAVLAYLSTQRAHRAERLADQTRAAAEQARAGAEHLLGYLSDDFNRELVSFGRINVIAEFSRQQIEYFHSLPPALQGPETTRNGAVAMVYYARANRQLGDLATASKNAVEAARLLEQLQRSGDHTEATTIALALAYTAQAQIKDSQNDSEGVIAGKHAVDLLRPVAEAPGASLAARRAFVDTLGRYGYELTAGNRFQDAIAELTQSRQIAADLGARTLADIDMAADYAEAGAWLVGCLDGLGRDSEAQSVGDEVIAIADKVLEQRPGYRLALHAQQVVEGSLAGVAQDGLNPAGMQRYSTLDSAVSTTLLQLDPHNVVSLNNLGVAHQEMGDAGWAAGRLPEAITYYLKSLDDYALATAGGASFVIIRAYDMAITSYDQAQMGDAAGAQATIASGRPYAEKLRQSEPPDSIALIIVDNLLAVSTAAAALERDDLPTAQRIGWDTAKSLQAAKASGDWQEGEKYISLYFALHVAGRAEYQLGNFAAAERAERGALEARKHWPSEATSDRRQLGELSIWLAMALARQGRLDEAAAEIGPVVKFQRGLAARNHGDQWQPVELASALYAQAMADRNQRARLLQEAAGILDNNVSPSLRSMHDVRAWRKRINDAMHATAAAAMPAALFQGVG
jgi:tetratricopeptide (TPR) repeat protein